MHLGLCDLNKLYAKFEEGFITGYDSISLKSWSIKTDVQSGFSCSGLFTPKFALCGAVIPKGNLDDSGLPWISMSVLPQRNSTVFSFCWDDAHSDCLEPLVTELQNCDKDSISNFCWELALRECENIAIAPSAWDKFTEEEKHQLVQFFQDTVYENWVPWINVYLK